MQTHKLSELSFGHAHKLMRTYKGSDEEYMKKVKRLYAWNVRFIYPSLRLMNRITGAKTIISGLGILFHNLRYEEDIFPLTTTMFENRPFMAPYDSDRISRHIYGDYVKLPDLSQLKPHTGSIEIHNNETSKHRQDIKEPTETDVAVLILFFNRPKELGSLFEQIKLARPSKLYLYQDGPRDDSDLPHVEACRKLLDNEQIDQECEVHRNYQEVNRGCDPSEYLSQRWAFGHEDECIVSEDDNVPTLSFFLFRKELFDRYAYDERIGMTAGINYDERTQGIPDDCFFTTTSSINGWASWKRVVDKRDATYSFLDDKYNQQQLEVLIKERKYQNDFIESCEYHRSVGKAYYETTFHAAIFFHLQLCIVSRVNMVSDAGATEDGVHLSGSNDDLPKAVRGTFTMQCHELSFPLKHPRYVTENVGCKHRMFRIMGWGHPWLKIGRSVEELFINLRKGNFKRIKEAMINRMRKLCSKSKQDQQ